MSKWKLEVLKICTKCGEAKPLSEYHKHGDGTRPDCKECRNKQTRDYARRPEVREHKREYMRKWQRKNRNHVREYQREYRKKHDHTKKWKQAQQKRNKRYTSTKSGKRVRAEAQKRYAAENEEKIKAQKIAQQAVKSGKLPHPTTQICIDCGNQAEHYHHENYDLPLDVTPLCMSCHIARHR